MFQAKPDVLANPGAPHPPLANTGELRWVWDPIPRDPADPAFQTWGSGSARRTGAANVWVQLSVDVARDLVFVPTSSPSPHRQRAVERKAPGWWPGDAHDLPLDQERTAIRCY